MDIFDVLKAITKRKIEFVRVGLDENIALKKAEFDVSREFNISLNDIRKLYRSSY